MSLSLPAIRFVSSSKGRNLRNWKSPSLMERWNLSELSRFTPPPPLPNPADRFCPASTRDKLVHGVPPFIRFSVWHHIRFIKKNWAATGIIQTESFVSNLYHRYHNIDRKNKNLDYCEETTWNTILFPKDYLGFHALDFQISS